MELIKNRLKGGPENKLFARWRQVFLWAHYFHLSFNLHVSETPSTSAQNKTNNKQKRQYGLGKQRSGNSQLDISKKCALSAGACNFTHFHAFKIFKKSLFSNAIRYKRDFFSSIENTWVFKLLLFHWHWITICIFA